MERAAPLPAGGFDPAEPVHDREPVPGLLVHRARRWTAASCEAAPLIGGAIVLDMLDGRIARLTNTASEFGAEFDSLADAISFGVAPALLAYRWALAAVPRVGWPAAFLFLACGVAPPGPLQRAAPRRRRPLLRGPSDPGGRGADRRRRLRPAGPAHASGCRRSRCSRSSSSLAFLMVSTFRYRSFKGVDLRRRRSYISVLGIALLFLIVATQPEASLLARDRPLHAVRTRSAGLLGAAPAAGRGRRRRSASRSPLREPGRAPSWASGASSSATAGSC